jgi:hypothetical protein
MMWGRAGSLSAQTETNKPLESLVELAVDEIFYKGETAELTQAKNVEIGFVLTAKKDSIHKIVVRYINLECSYYDAGSRKTVRVRSSATTYSVRCPLDKIAFGETELKYITDGNGNIVRGEWVASESITDLKFNGNGAVGTVKFSYAASKQYGGNEVIPLGTATIHFIPVIAPKNK